MQGCVRACSRSTAQQAATTASGLELGSHDGLDGTIGFDGNQSRDVDPIDDRFYMPSGVDGGHRFGDLTQVRNQAVLAADPMASKQPAAWEEDVRIVVEFRRRPPRVIDSQTVTASDT